MAQFDIYRNPIEEAREQYPYLLDIQSNLLNTLRTRAVVPLARNRQLPATQSGRLTPELIVNSQRLYMMTPNLVAVDLSELGRVVASLSEHRFDIIAAMDYLISGV
jgi:toxin CcdB